MERNNRPRSFDLAQLERRAAFRESAKRRAHELRNEAIAEAWDTLWRALSAGAKHAAALYVRASRRAPGPLSTKV